MARKAKGKGGSDGESVGGYFREIFMADPSLLNTRSNDAILQRWLSDHGETEVPPRIKNILANIKSVIRKKLRKGGRRKKKAAVAVAVVEAMAPVLAVAYVAGTKIPVPMLEQLEVQVDDCLTLARSLDQDKLAGIISHLRKARNAVVWKLGERG
jgi:hypothetical protein